MEQFLYPTLTAFFAALITWFFSRKSTEIENEIKSADFYRNLLDDAIVAIEKRDLRIKERDEKIEQLIDEIELLTGELRKYKQLNGKA